MVQTFYDIVKAHRGELKVEFSPTEAVAGAAQPEEGSNFIISLPINKP